MAKRHFSRSHFSRDQIIQSCKEQAKRNRMADRNIYHDLSLCTAFIFRCRFEWNDDEMVKAIGLIEKYYTRLIGSEKVRDGYFKTINEYYGRIYTIEPFTKEIIDKEYRPGSHLHLLATRSIEASNYAMETQNNFTLAVAMAFMEMKKPEEILSDFENAFCEAYNKLILSDHHDAQMQAIERKMEEEGFGFEKPIDPLEVVNG